MSNKLKKANSANRQTARGGRRLARRAEPEERTLSRRKGADEGKDSGPVRAEAAARSGERQRAGAAVLTEKTAPRAENSRSRENAAGQTCRAEAQNEMPNGGEGPVTRLLKTVRKETRRARRRWRHIVREKKAKNFPESERVPIQLLLFGWSMLPMLGAHLREATWGRRKRLMNRFGQARTWAEHHKVHPAAFLGVGCGVAAIALVCSFYTVGTTVTYKGEKIAAVTSRSAAEEARSKLETVTARTLGESFSIDDSLLQYSSGIMRRQDVVDEATYEEDLSEEIGLVTPAYCLYVEGERIGATPYEGALEELLEQLKAAATDADTISCEFSENVEIKQEYVPTSEIMNLGYLAQTLYSTKTAEVTYEVKKGDTWSQIANSHDLTSVQLLALNPGYNIDKLQIGEVLTLSASVPYLTMTVVQRERYIDDVPFEIEYTDTANLYKGDYKVTSAGQYGAADVVANVTYVNGEEVQRDILSSVTLRNPVTEQRLQGTKERPTWLPTGTFRWPVTGRITSRFGGRKSPGGIGSTNHKGIDIAAPRGTPVYAADGGTVTYAGWMSGYGYLVRVSHGNGYETYYGHNSSITVSMGQHVYKGQQVARVGSTGNSTGNHCHFEVRYNGAAKNPLNYLP